MMIPTVTVRWVLSQFPVAEVCRDIVSLGNHGGFSGARLWRVEAVAGPWCLRAWPENGITGEQLFQIHQLMALARLAGLDFVPAVCPTKTGQSWVEHQNRFWELTQWLPGQADFSRHSSPARLRAACLALARLHQAWAGIPDVAEMDKSPTRERGEDCSSLARRAFIHLGRERISSGPCPAVARRWDRLRQWQHLCRAGWRPNWTAQPPDLAGLGRTAWQLLEQHLPALPALLQQAGEKVFALQPCLCDIWHDHVLFQGEQVSGIIDYGSIKIDNVAVDLARLLGSLIADVEENWQVGIAAYRSVRALSPDEEALARILDRTGTLLGLVNWLVRLFHDFRHFESPDRISRQMAKLLDRVQNWP